MCSDSFVTAAVKSRIAAHAAAFRKATQSPFGSDDEIGMLNLVDGESRRAIMDRADPSRIYRVDPADFLHKCLQPRLGFLATSNIAQRSCPFADRLAIDFIVRRGPNDRSEWVCGLVERKTSDLERMPQKPLGPSSHSVMLDDCEHRC